MHNPRGSSAPMPPIFFDQLKDPALEKLHKNISDNPEFKRMLLPI